MSSVIFDHATEYCRQGLRVFPVHYPVCRDNKAICSCGKPSCKNIGKHPASPKGLKDATTDRRLIKSWFEHQIYNVGIRTGAESGIFVIDCDPRHGGDESLAELEAEHGPLPETWRFNTGGGGEHHVFRHPGGVIRNSASLIAPGIDIRGEGGYIVGPPSRHASGVFYLIADNSHEEIAEAPEWLLSLVLSSPKDEQQTEAGNEKRPAIFRPAEWRQAEAARVRSAINFIPSDNRDFWLRVGMALHSTGWESEARAIWDEWSRTSVKFEPRDQDRTWRNFGRGGVGRRVTLGTLFWLAEQSGWDGKSSSRLIAHRAGILLARGISPHVCLDRMLEFNSEHCIPPLSEDEVLGIVATITQREIAKWADIGGRRND